MFLLRLNGVETGYDDWTLCIPPPFQPKKLRNNKLPVALDLKLQPNPAFDQVTIVYQTPSVESISITVQNAQGKVVFQQEVLPENGNINLDISTWASGVYFFTIKIEGGIMRSEKLLKLQ